MQQISTPPETLVAENTLSPSFIYDMSKRFGLPMLDLDYFNKALIPLELIDETLTKKYHLLPLHKRENHLYIAVDDPRCIDAIHELKFKTGAQIHCILVQSHKLTNLIDEILHLKSAKKIEAFTPQHFQYPLTFRMEQNQDHLDLALDKQDNDTIISFVNNIIYDAIIRLASDIHFEPYEKNFRIRFRIDGILHERKQLPIHLASRIITRLKVLSNLDISERRLPHDGRCKMKLNATHEVDFRVSTCPTVNGEKVVMRLLDPTNSQIKMDNLGMNSEQISLFTQVIKQSQGMVLVTGPTGSGKSATLYAALNILNTGDKNISTAEDPVEIKVSGINQVHINPKAGLTFAKVLRSFLRQDPDIIMIGEMRDLETADIAIKAAQTGHMVLSTLHTNSAATTLIRLMNMNIAPYHIASSVTLIVAQQLVRKLCKHCRQPYQVPSDSLLKYGFNETNTNSITLFKALGCQYCLNGYRGRTGVFELLPLTESICHKILSMSHVGDIEKQARQESILSMRQVSLEKVKQGITTLEEIERILKD